MKHATIADIKPALKNARVRTERGAAMIARSIEENGFGRSVLLANDGSLIAGSGTIDGCAEVGIEDVIIVPSDGTKIIAVQRNDIAPGSPAAHRLAIADNRTTDLSDFDPAVVAALADEVDLSDFWRADELDALLATIGTDADDARDPSGTGVARETLAERFLVPPFSVLDARQGYWQERKRAWLALGIQSELGRGEHSSPGGSPRDAATLGDDGHTVRGDGRGGLLGESEQTEQYRKRAGGYARTFGQDLMRGEHVVGAEGAGGGRLTWVAGERDAAALDETSRKNLAGGRRKDADRRSNVTDAPPLPHWATETGTENMAAGTSIFDPVLCELAYAWFCPPGGAVLDPFAGGSVRGIVAAKLGRAYTGIDLSAPQIAANERQAADIVPDAPPRWIVGDAAEAATLAPGEYDFLFSCPPYGDLERYSDDPRDLSTMPYADFLASYRRIVAAAVGMLREDRFAAFVVGDIRDPKGMYRNFVSDTIAAFHDAGMRLYNEAILVTSVGSLPIRVGRQFAGGRKLGKTHQNVLVFVKGDPKKATAACGDVQVWVPDEAEVALAAD